MSTTALELVTSDGITLRGRRWVPTATARATVVLVHGFAASSSEDKVVDLATQLCDAGFGVVAVDSRGHGASGGQATLGDAERHDVAAAVAAARSAAEPIVLVGASMGAIGVLRHLAERGADATPVLGAVTVSCPARWKLPRNARGLLSAVMTYTPVGRWGTRRYLHIDIAKPAARPAPPSDLVPQIHVPLVLIHGRADPFIPVGDAELLHDVANDPKRLQVVDAMGHAFEPPSIGPVLAAVDWLLARP
ncbi:MAG: alpha/beta fold hydrolase [Acidimicrobiia bacterium]